MTTNEEHSELGRMVVERAELRRRLACIKSKLSRYKALLTYAEIAVSDLDTAKNWRTEDGALVLNRPDGIYDMGPGGSFPTPTELSDALQARIDLTNRLKELDELLNAAGC